MPLSSAQVFTCSCHDPFVSVTLLEHPIYFYNYHSVCYVSITIILLLLSFNLLKMTRVADSKIHHYTDADSEVRLATDNSPSWKLQNRPVLIVWSTVLKNNNHSNLHILYNRSRCVVWMQEGGLNGFMHSFLAEVMAICRAHVAALGGNALVAFQLTECIIEDNVHKNQVMVASCFTVLLTTKCSSVVQRI